MPKISVIVLTFNSKKFIVPCLNSVFAQDKKDFEVIVVDNGSCDGTTQLIETNFSQVKLIKNSSNLGACFARNQGIQAAHGKWVLTLDCDIVLKKDFLAKIAEQAKNSSEAVGMVQPKILNKDGSAIFSCGIFLSKARRFYDIGKGYSSRKVFNSKESVLGACCAAALYRKDMLDALKEKTGFFDERFFFLAEDMDLAWRAHKKGWKTVLCLDAACFHNGNSSGFDSKLRQYLCFRNRFYAILKNEGLKGYLGRVFPVLFYDIPRFFYLIFTNSYVRMILRTSYVCKRRNRIDSGAIL